MYVRSKVNLYLSGGYSRITECKDYDDRMNAAIKYIPYCMMI